MSKGNPSLALLFCFTVGLTSVGEAQESSFMGTIPSVDALVDVLKLESTRGIVPKITVCSQDTRGIEIVSPKSAVLDIKFAFDSAVLTPTARTILDQLGTALARDELADDRFLIEGHTDAKGSEAYNLALSERRAVSAGDYLRDAHGIAADRLSYTCKGESEPLDPADPENAVNRRIEVRNLGG